MSHEWRPRRPLGDPLVSQSGSSRLGQRFFAPDFDSIWRGERDRYLTSFNKKGLVSMIAGTLLTLEQRREAFRVLQTGIEATGSPGVLDVMSRAELARHRAAWIRRGASQLFSNDQTRGQAREVLRMLRAIEPKPDDSESAKPQTKQPQDQREIERLEKYWKRVLRNPHISVRRSLEVRAILDFLTEQKES